MFVARAQHRVARCYISPCPPPFATPILLFPPHLSLHSRSAAWCPSLSLRSDSVLWQYIFQTLLQPSANSSSSSRPQLLIEFINWVVQVMFASAVLSFGLLLAPTAFAAVHDVTVGSSAGALEFSPEAIVCSIFSEKSILFPLLTFATFSHAPVR